MVQRESEEKNSDEEPDGRNAVQEERVEAQEGIIGKLEEVQEAQQTKQQLQKSR